MKTILHVDQHALRRNRTQGCRLPPLTLKTYKSNRRAKEVEINGPCRLIYRPDSPLACGATVWIETKAGVKIVA